MVPEEISAIIQPFVKQISIMVGGIFGLYLILIIYKIVSNIHLQKTIRDIKEELKI